MKKKFIVTRTIRKVLIVCSMASACMFGLSSCSDDYDDSEPYVPEKIESSELSSNVSARLFIIDPWQGDVVFPIAADLNFESLEWSGKYLNFLVREGADRNYLVLALKNAELKNAFMESVKIGNEDVYFVCRSSEKTIGASDLPDYLNTIGHSISVTGEILSDPIAPMLDFTHLYADTCIVRTSKSDGYGAEISGSRYNESVHEMSESMGLSAAVPTQYGTFSGSFNQAFSKSDISSDKYEYHIDIYRKIFADCHMTPKFTIQPSDNDSTAADKYLPYITREANELLNDPQSDLYKQFSNDQQGIFELYKAYGTHIMTGGIYGGTYIYVFGRKQTATFRSTANAAGASLSYKKVGAAGEEESWMQTYFRVMAAAGGTISAEGENYDSDEEEVTKAKSFFVIKGGNASEDFESWDNSLKDSNSNLALVAYGPNNKSSYMIPLYYLAKDPSRRAAMKQWYDTYLVSNYPGKEEVPLVIADFKMETVDSEDDIPEHKIETGPDGKSKLIYYPLILNNNFGNTKDWGRAVNTANDNFLAVAQSDAQVWWYALEFADECSPISSIRFYEDDEAKDEGYLIRGDRADDGMNWPAIDNHYVALKFENYKKEDVSNYIKGVGLMHDFKIIATSVGTDMTSPYNDSKLFEYHWVDNKYWNDINDDQIGADYIHHKKNKDKKEDIIEPLILKEDESWFGENPAIGHEEYVFPVYTKKNLQRPIKVVPPKAY